MAVVFDKVMTAIAAGFTFAVKPAFFFWIWIDPSYEKGVGSDTVKPALLQNR